MTTTEITLRSPSPSRSHIGEFVREIVEGNDLNGWKSMFIVLRYSVYMAIVNP